MPESGLLDRLREDDATRAWLEHLETLEPMSAGVHLPTPTEMIGTLVDLAVPHEDIGPLIRMTPSPDHTPEAWWLLERAVASINDFMGSFDNPPAPPPLPRDDPFLHYFYVYVFVALKPLVESWFRRHDIPPDIARHSLADLGRSMAVHRKRFGFGGLNLAAWLQLHFRGAIYQLGRLQFQRAKLGETTGTAIREAGHPFGPGDLRLGLHIPDFTGPFSPDLCDASFAWAREFFPRHFPDEPYGVATCHSWLLDPQLAEYLPETSNIIQFQRRFTLVDHTGEPRDDVAFEFVFGRKASEIDLLPTNTSIQRALIEHVRAGKHWHVRGGWMLL